MTLFWFTPSNEAELEDVEFLKNLGIEVRAPRGQTTFYRDPDSGKMVGFIGKVFVLQDGRVVVRPCADTSDGALRILLRTALDCAERDHHLKHSGWFYRRKTTKRQGFWVSRILCAVNTEGTMARELVAMQDLLSSPEQWHIPEHELAPETQEAK